MRTARHILAGIIALALLSSGLPVFSPEDANRNARVDLGDAIMNVRGFAASAESPKTFRVGAERAISTMKALAGVKSTIGAVKETKSSPTSPSFFYLPPTVDPQFSLEICSQVIEPSLIYQSYEPEPNTPPPERA